MEKITVGVEGMMCGMCEAHINDAIRNTFSVKSVKASRAKHSAEIIAEDPIDPDKLREVIEKTGYKVTGISSEPYKKKGLFGLGK